MNPFSGFLQPQNNRPLQGLATTQDLLRVNQGQKEMAQRKLENEQQNARANSYLALQQGDQAHRWGAEEQKQVEGLLAEYQDAEDQGDPVRLSRAAQMLKRFGMDVGQKQAPDLRAFTGEAALPAVKKSPVNLQDFTGQPPNPIDAAVQQELQSREALRERNMAGDQAAGEQNLSPEEWERQFISGAPEPDGASPSGEPDIAGHLKSVGPLKALKLNTAEEQERASSAEKPMDMGDVDSPEFKQAAAQEGGVIDLDAEDPTPLQVGQPQGGSQPVPQPRRLATQLLPTVISKGGKQLYESTGPSGRWSPMVQGVFQPFLEHGNPEIASAAKRAQQMSAKLTEVDGVAPKDAIKLGMDYLKGEAALIVGLERTKLGTKPRGMGGIGSGGSMGSVPLTGKDMAALGDDAQGLMLAITAKPEYQKVSVMDDVLNGAEAALASGDPLRQQQAISDIMRARSGLTVRKDEESGLRNAAGLWEGIKARLSQEAGYGLTQDYQKALSGALTAQRAINQRIRKRIAEETRQFYLKTRTTSDADTGSRAQQVRRNSEAIEGMLSRDGASGDSEEDLY
jgi:hypothetical protein